MVVPRVNEPLTIDITASATRVVVGSSVTLDVHAVDPDAVVTENCGSYRFSPAPDDLPQIGFACVATREREPESSPVAGSLDLTFQQRFDRVGVYEFVIELRSGPDYGSVYASAATATVQIEVVDS